MDKKDLLFEASLQGNVSSLVQLLKEDPLILDRDSILNPSFETSLHVASLLGHLEFVQEIIIRKPELATELNSTKSSPLHLASAKGYVEIVKELVSVRPEMCLARDRDGYNPLHLAAMKGRIDVLKELLRVRVHASRATVHKNETILHLCVKYHQLESLKLILEKVSDHEFLNSKDDDGHTILHLAVADKQIETVKFLLLNTTIEVNSQNADGVTPMGILARSRKDASDKKIMEILRHAGAFEENRVNSEALNHTETLLTRNLPLEYPPQNKVSHKRKEKQNEWLENHRSTLMVVATLIAAVAFQVGINPPGGVWANPEDKIKPVSAVWPNLGVKSGHVPGWSILAVDREDVYTEIVIVNTVSFISSLTTILLLISGLPCMKRRIFIWILMVTMWVAVTTLAFTFLLSVAAVTPYNLRIDKTNNPRTLVYVLTGVIVGWSILMFILILFHTIRIIFKGLRKLKKSCC